MRIGFGCTMFEPEITQGQIDGVGYYAKFLLDELLAANHQVVPFSFPPMKNWKMQTQIANGNTFQFPYMVATGASLLTPRIFSLYPSVENRLDIFHSTDHLVPKFKKTKIIATLHDALIMRYPEWFKPRFRHSKNWLRKKTMNWADHFITISNSMRQEVIEYWGIKPEKISVIYNGISPWWYEKLSDEIKQQVMKKLGVPSNFILVVGTLQPKKNIPRIVDAFLKLPQDIQQQFPLVIVGKSGWNTEESEAAVEKLIASKNGFWLRYISNSDLHALYQAASMHLHPSLHEGFGLTVLQAFASGTATITSNITAMPEIAGNAAYLVDPLSVDSIANGIQLLATNPSLRKDLIEKGYARAKEFSWKKCADKTVELYHSLL